EFVITQLFFDNRDYFDYVGRLRRRGLNVRVIPGILPITNYEGAVKFCQGCGASIPETVHQLFRPIAEVKDHVLRVGTEFTIKQCQELLAQGAPGIHFYTLNKLEPVKTILDAIRS
ncbi:MAG: methylenetetrahydrofolate reductase [NAD(P)H], partial [Candidatus Omnitrophica bacterium]|nr:methylenetetrahydrofolate reductase [NAD(P)H] [Candidatus Omnitrophota bacterium]